MIHLLYKVLFSPIVIFDLLHFQTVSPSLEFVQTRLRLIERDNLRHWKSPSLEFARWPLGRYCAEKNGREYFPVYSLLQAMIKVHHKLWYMYITSYDTWIFDTFSLAMRTIVSFLFSKTATMGAILTFAIVRIVVKWVNYYTKVNFICRVWWW